MKKEGQISIEYMAIVGFVTVVLILLLGISNYYSTGTQDQIAVNQVDQIAKQVIDAAESVYYWGEPSKNTIKVFMPEKVELINITTNEITFVVKTTNGNSDIAYSSSVNLTGSIQKTQGIHYINVEAKEGYVWINST